MSETNEVSETKSTKLMKIILIIGVIITIGTGILSFAMSGSDEVTTQSNTQETNPF